MRSHHREDCEGRRVCVGGGEGGKVAGEMRITQVQWNGCL